jgi:hypothetical protein
VRWGGFGGVPSISYAVIGSTKLTSASCCVVPRWSAVKWNAGDVWNNETALN